MGIARPTLPSTVVVMRTHSHQPTLDCVRRYIAEEKRKRNIIRRLKRFVALKNFGYRCRTFRAVCPTLDTAWPLYEHQCR